MDAVNLTRLHHPDLVIMDIILTNTGVDGIEATRLIKRNPSTHDTKILLISGLVDLHSEEIKALGVDAILAKPFSSTRLHRTVVQLLAIASSPKH